MLSFFPAQEGPDDGALRLIPTPQSVAVFASAIRVAAILLLAAAGVSQVPCGLANPGFEDVSVSGVPLGWAAFREAFCDDSTSLARTGRRSVRSSAAFGWAQFLGAPCAPWQSFAVRGYASREFAFERAGARVSFFGNSGTLYLTDRQDLSPVASESAYGEFVAVVEVPEGADTVGVYPVGQSLQNWIRFDDLGLLTEQFTWGASPCGEGWIADGGASVTSDTLMLADSTSVSQRVVTGLQNQVYFVAGRYAVSSSATLTVCDDWLPRGSDEQGTATECSISLLPDSGSFVAELPRPAHPPSGVSRVRIVAQTGDHVALTSVTRGFSKAEPVQWTVGDSSPDKPLRLTAAWPGELTSATIDIVTSGGSVVVQLPVSLHGTTARSSWEGSGMSAGTYAARFSLVSTSGQAVTLVRPFHLCRADGLTSVVQPLVSSSFNRVAWVFSVFESDTRLDQLVELARQDGYNVVFGHCRPDQLPQLRASCERLALPFVHLVPQVSAVLQPSVLRDYFSRTDYLDQVHALVSPVLGSAFLRGIYVLDEPVSADALDITRRASLALAQDGTLGAAFSVIPHIVAPADMLLAGTAVCLVDIYPYRPSKTGTNSSALRDLVYRANAYAAAAANAGRELWLVLQSFEEPGMDGFHAVPNTIHWGQLGGAVLAGAKGVAPFLYSAVSYAEGQRGPDLEPTRKLAPYRRFNNLMDRIGPLVMRWSLPLLDTRAPEPFAVSATQISPNDRYVTVLNSNDRTTQTLLLAMDVAPVGPLNDLVQLQPLPLDPMGRVVVELGPGEWAVIPVGSSSIASLVGTNDPGVSLSTCALPVTHEFVVRRGNGLVQPVLGLDLSPSSDTIAVSTGFYYYEADGPQVYRLNPDGTIDRESGPPTYPSDRSNFLDDGSLVRCSLSFGMRQYPAFSLGGMPLRDYAGVSGGVYSFVSRGSDVWVTMGGYGIRRLRDTGTTLESVETGIPDSDIYRDIFGPFDDASVSIVVRNHGVHNVKPSSVQESAHIRAPLNRTDTNAALSASGMLAVPRNQRGVGLFQLNTSGEPTLVGEAATDAVDVTASAWLGDEVLALADGGYHVRFYRLAASGLQFLCAWRPGAGEPVYIRALAARGGRLAVGLHDGRVFVVDAAQLVVSRAGMWQLYR